MYIKKSNLSSEINIVLTLIDIQTYTNVPGIIPIKVPKIYECIFILKKAGITLTTQNGIKGINLREIRYNKSFFLNPFSNLLKKEKIFFLKTEKDKNKHLQHYNEIDIALDTFPYNGVTTSFESIWMGVPVLTKIGNNYSSRCGYSINKNLRLEEFIAIDNEDYISKAISFSSEKNLNNLNNLRKSLREKAASSVLFDGKLFAENFSKKILEVVNKPI